jgi:hypothetical protein
MAAKIADPLGGAVIKQQRAQQPLLRFGVLRQRAICGLLVPGGRSVSMGLRSDPSVTIRLRLKCGGVVRQILLSPVALKLRRNGQSRPSAASTIFPLDTLSVVCLARSDAEYKYKLH